MTKLVNLTPHALRVRIEESNIPEPLESDIVLEPAGPAVRVSSKSVVVGEINGVPIVRTEFGGIDNLPAPKDDVVYVTSMIAAQRASQIGRTDVIGPNTGPGADIRYPKEHKLAGLTFAVRTFQRF